MEVAGVAIGAAGLSLQILDSIISGYKLYLGAANMPDDCADLRTRLELEYRKLLVWSEEAGLLELEYEQELPDILRVSKLLLISILTQIQHTMDEFAAVNGKYVELQQGEEVSEKTVQKHAKLSEDFASVELRYKRSLEQRQARRKHARGTNHILSMGKNTWKMATQPRRLAWVAWDAEVFRQLLDKLAGYNRHLADMMHDHRARRLEERTRATYLEMVQLRSSVADIKVLLSGARQHRGGPDVSPAERRNLDLLRSLARFKELTLAQESSAPDDTSAATADLAKLDPRKLIYLTYASQQAAGDLVRTPAWARMSPGHFWIEWKEYNPERDVAANGTLVESTPEDSVQRIRGLVSLMQNSGVERFNVPRCLGYFDERGLTPPGGVDPSSYHLSTEVAGRPRFGIVFQGPDRLSPDPVSLFAAIASLPCPSLAARVALACRIAESVLYLHVVKWLHKGLRSDSVTFFPPPGDTAADDDDDYDDAAKAGPVVDYTRPYLSGFVYARPDHDDAKSSAVPHDLWAEMYVHPAYQGDDKIGTFRKEFDVYSLGVVLLEIFLWEHVQATVGIGDLAVASTEKIKEVRAVRERILDAAAPEGRVSVLDRLRERAGDRVHDAVKSCIVGLEAFGLSREDNEMKGEAAATLQEQFTDLVVDKLRAIVI